MKEKKDIAKLIHLVTLYCLNHYPPKYLGDSPRCSCGHNDKKDGDHDSECEIELFAYGLYEFLLKEYK